jgi:hypothetical protein
MSCPTFHAKNRDRRGIICVALRQAIEALAKPAMAAGSGVDVAGRAYYETTLSDFVDRVERHPLFRGKTDVTWAAYS